MMAPRMTLEAKQILDALPEDRRKKVLEYLASKGVSFVHKEHVDDAVKISGEETTSKVEVVRPTYYKPKAKDYDASIEVDHKRDVTGKSRTKGAVSDFVRYFQNRFRRIKALFPSATTGYSEIGLGDLRSANGEKACMVVMVKEKRQSKNGNLVLVVEDMEGTALAVVSKSNEQIADTAKLVVDDDIIRIYGRVRDKLILVEDIEFPDVKERIFQPRSDKEVAVAYISDLHFGSRFCMERLLKKFLSVLKDPKGKADTVGKIKYLVVAGDVVDGIGIYPGQENELTVKDIFGQYELFDKFLQEVPDYIEVIVAPGNHDAVRRGEPMPSLKESFFTNNKPLLVGNPSYVNIEGFIHLIYHGTSMDSLVANVPGLSYHKVEPIMREYYRRRHLSPIYGTNPIVPEEVDYLVMDVVPHVFHTGHIHKNGNASYRGSIMINSGTFQDQTDYQLKQGHIPTPGMVPVYELDTNKFSIMDLRTGLW